MQGIIEDFKKEPEDDNEKENDDEQVKQFEPEAKRLKEDDASPDQSSSTGHKGKETQQVFQMLLPRSSFDCLRLSSPQLSLLFFSTGLALLSSSPPHHFPLRPEYRSGLVQHPSEIRSQSGPNQEPHSSLCAVECDGGRRLCSTHGKLLVRACPVMVCCLMTQSNGKGWRNVNVTAT